MQEEELQKRMRIAEEEMQMRAHYDFVVVNDVLETAVDEVYKIINS